MICVSKIAHAAYETPDLPQQAEYYTEIIGLTLAAQEKDAVISPRRSITTPSCCARVRRRNAPASAFRIPPSADLDAFEKQVAGHGIATERRKDPEPSIKDMLVFADPKGTVMEVFKRDAFSHQKFQSKGIVPYKLGHVAFHVTDVKRVTKFYCDVLGFRESDWMGDFFSFLRCGPDHHTINLMETGSNRHFHTAFELRDWAHLQQACDLLSLRGYKLIWGPGRHGIGHNLFAYHRAPNGLITETFAELDRMNEELGYFEPRPWHRDNPQRPKVWAKDPSAANLWGILPSDEMMK